jgi:hypothetical protein
MDKRNKHCVQNGCKHDGKAADDMIRCVLCTVWFHHTCVDIDPSTPDGVWSCPSCRNIYKDVNSIKQSVAQINGTLAIQSDILVGLRDSLKSKNDECERLRQENTELRKKTDELTKRLDEASIHTKSVLLGSSIIREVDEEKLINTDVVCKRGGTIEDIREEVNKLPDECYSHLSLVIGGNDCDKNPPKPAKDIVEKYGELISAAKEKARSVTVSSICPRFQSKNVQQCIESVNAGLIATCNEMGVNYADSTPCFRLGDGTINDGYFTEDGVHITHAATNKLAVNMKLKVKDKSKGVCKDYNKQKQHENSREWTTVTKKGQRQQFQQHKRAEQQRHEYQAITGQYKGCHNCGEVNHDQQRCRFSFRLKCRRCSAPGHKEKHCDY